MKVFVKAGKYEEMALKKCKNVIGRTDWDRACVYQINPTAEYFFNNETLRPQFYNGQWNVNNCERHSVFISQGNYPIKGLHFAIEGLGIVKKEFPDLKVYVAGGDIVSHEKMKPKWRRNAYSNYLIDLIEKNKLQDCIVFCGMLTEENMKKRFLRSNVFVSPSTIENSPNSVGEAMILGVPIVSSDVGGVKDMLNHKEEGFIYQLDAPYMLAYYISQIFRVDNVANAISERARVKACKTHSQENNAMVLKQIYRTICSNTIRIGD